MRLLVIVGASLALLSTGVDVRPAHGHHHRHRRHNHSRKAALARQHSVVHGAATATASAAANASEATEANILGKLRAVTTEVAEAAPQLAMGHLRVGGPLPDDFQALFQRAAADALGTDGLVVSIASQEKLGDDLVLVNFEAPADAVHALEDQAADPESKLATGALRPFLVAREPQSTTPTGSASADTSVPAVPAQNLDVDQDLPYGDIEPFGREDTGQELTESSIKQSDTMVDQLERAEVAEEKRAVFRSLTRLRGAAITSFDGIARSQTGNIDEYSKVHQWRTTHPLNHLAQQESDVATWAFPEEADM